MMAFLSFARLVKSEISNMFHMNIKEQLDDSNFWAPITWQYPVIQRSIVYSMFWLTEVNSH